MPIYLPLALLASRFGMDRFHKVFAETPFAGIHQLAWFDWAMLIPYFTILLVLSVYGVHRYEIIHTYFKHRKRATKEPRRCGSSNCRRSRFSCRCITSVTWWSG